MSTAMTAAAHGAAARFLNPVPPSLSTLSNTDAEISEFIGMHKGYTPALVSAASAPLTSPKAAGGANDGFSEAVAKADAAIDAPLRAAILEDFSFETPKVLPWETRDVDDLLQLSNDLPLFAATAANDTTAGTSAVPQVDFFGVDDMDLTNWRMPFKDCFPEAFNNTPFATMHFDDDDEKAAVALEAMDARGAMVTKMSKAEGGDVTHWRKRAALTDEAAPDDDDDLMDMKRHRPCFAAVPDLRIGTEVARASSSSSSSPSIPAPVRVPTPVSVLDTTKVTSGHPVLDHSVSLWANEAFLVYFNASIPSFTNLVRIVRVLQRGLEFAWGFLNDEERDRMRKSYKIISGKQLTGGAAQLSANRVERALRNAWPAVNDGVTKPDRLSLLLDSIAARVEDGHNTMKATHRALTATLQFCADHMTRAEKKFLSIIAESCEPFMVYNERRLLFSKATAADIDAWIHEAQGRVSEMRAGYGVDKRGKRWFPCSRTALLFARRRLKAVIDKEAGFIGEQLPTTAACGGGDGCSMAKMFLMHPFELFNAKLPLASVDPYTAAIALTHPKSEEETAQWLVDHVYRHVVPEVRKFHVKMKTTVATHLLDKATVGNVVDTAGQEATQPLLCAGLDTRALQLIRLIHKRMIRHITIREMAESLKNMRHWFSSPQSTMVHAWKEFRVPVNFTQAVEIQRLLVSGWIRMHCTVVPKTPTEAKCGPRALMTETGSPLTLPPSSLSSPLSSSPSSSSSS